MAPELHYLEELPMNRELLITPSRIEAKGRWVTYLTERRIPTNLGEAEAIDIGVGQLDTGEIVLGIQAILNGQTVEIRVQGLTILTHLVNGYRLAVLSHLGCFEITGVASLLQEVRETLCSEGCPGHPEEALLMHLI
jgi:hypothetical protein